MVSTVIWIGALLLVANVFIVVAVSMITTARDLETPLRPGETDRCPMCGMLVAPHTDWISQVRHSDGTTVFFAGCKDLFKYLLSLDRYEPEKDRKNVASVFVTNYYDGEVIAARTALFVVGSNAHGPIGQELVPHRSYVAAEDFMRDHHGKRILRFEEITESILNEMT